MSEGKEKEVKKASEEKSETGEKAGECIEAAKPIFKKIGNHLGGENGALAAEGLSAFLQSAATDNPASIIEFVAELFEGHHEDPTQKLLETIDKKVDEISKDLKELSNFVTGDTVAVKIKGINSHLETLIADISIFEKKLKLQKLSNEDLVSERSDFWIGINNTILDDVRTCLGMLADYVSDNPNNEIADAYVCTNFFAQFVNMQPVEDAAKHVAAYFSRMNKAFLNAAQIAMMSKFYNPDDTLLDEVNTQFEIFRKGIEDHFGCLQKMGVNYLTNPDYLPEVQLIVPMNNEFLSVGLEYSEIFKGAEYKKVPIIRQQINSSTVEKWSPVNFQLDQGKLKGVMRDDETLTYIPVGLYFDVAVFFETMTPFCALQTSFYYDVINFCLIDLIRVHNIKKPTPMSNPGNSYVPITPQIMVSLCNTMSICMSYESEQKEIRVEILNWLEGKGYRGLTGQPQDNQVFYLCMDCNAKGQNHEPFLSLEDPEIDR